jgi:hypothetical protein
MSFGVMSGLPPEEKYCPVCGERIPATAARCWLCLEKLSAQVAATGKPRREHDRARRASGDQLIFIVLGILAILLCIAFAFAAPGLLILLIVLLAPAFVRTAIQMKRSTSAGEEQSPDKGRSFGEILFSSVGVVALVGFIAFHAFWAAFLVACFPALAISSGGQSLSLFLVITIGAGIIASVFVAVMLFRVFWSTSR